MIRGLKGMEDLVPPESARWQTLETKLHHHMNAFGFDEIRTPLLEPTSLFLRSVGEQTDIVEKEMYTFSDKNGESVTLRPENTASVIRAYVEHALHVASPLLKVYYLGPMFRHERPQKGRLRQFHQLGVEMLGTAHPLSDVECMQLLFTLCQGLGVASLDLQINSVGDEDCRPRYRKDLQAYLMKHRDALDETSVRRLESNPLRIFDSKSESTQEVLKGAPLLIDYLSPGAQSHLHKVQDGLKACGVPYTLNPRLVRGLDYYTHTVFELLSHEGLGAQNVVGAGGRYNNLVEELGGPPTPAVGFALGMERLLSLSQNLDVRTPRTFAFIGLDEASSLAVVEWVAPLRAQLAEQSIRVNLILDRGSLKSALRQADKMQAEVAFIVGESERLQHTLQAKFLREKRSEVVPASDLQRWIKEIL